MLTSVWRRAIPGVAAAAVAFTTTLPAPLNAQSADFPAFKLGQPQADFNLMPAFPRSKLSDPSETDLFEYQSPSGQPYMKSTQSPQWPNCNQLPAPGYSKSEPFNPTEALLGEATTAGTRVGAINDFIAQEFPDAPRLGPLAAKSLGVASTVAGPIYELAVNKDDQAAAGSLVGGVIGGTISLKLAKEGSKWGGKHAGAAGYALGAVPGLVLGATAANKIGAASETLFKSQNIHFVPSFVPGFERPIIDLKPVSEHSNPQVQSIIDRYGVDTKQAVADVDKDASAEERALWHGRRLEAVVSIMESACTRDLKLEEELKQEIEMHYEEVCYETTHRPTMEEQLLMAADTNQMPDYNTLPEIEAQYNVRLQAFCNR